MLMTGRFCLVLGVLVAAEAGSELDEQESREAQQDPYQMSWEVALAKGDFALRVDDCAFTFRGGTDDPGQVLIDIPGADKPLIYRLWPDITKWSLPEEGKALYSSEFESIRGWRERTIRVSVDVGEARRRVWVDGRLVKVWRAAEDRAPTLAASPSDKRTGPSLSGREVGMGRFLELDLTPYFNAGADAPYTPDASIDLDGMAKLRYESKPAAPHDIDLGKLAYRDAHMDKGPFQRLSMPYVNCDAMSSDPRRAIFRVPARFYDRLHLLCYADGDAGEVPRAAVRFMKTGRVRFLTREFGVVPEEGVRVSTPREIGGRQCAHVVVDLNPAAFQEFLSEPANEYFEFELTRPVAMDNNSFEYPAGSPSSLHVLAMALEEAPVAMTVTSDEPGHLFEDHAEAKMLIRLASCCDEEQSGIVNVNIAMPNGHARRESFDFRLAGHDETSFEMNVGDAPVGKSDFTARLEVTDARDERRVMERRTSFALLPAFERTAEDSPFGMWSFFEGHHGADIETTCGVLRKAGVRGTLANFVLATGPETWEENTRRTATLRAHGIEVNWGYLGGVAQTALDGLGDLDAKFAWIEAHPQVKDYNLFWETRVGKRGPTTCPPEIRGRAPITWTAEEREQLDTFMNFGTAWAERARRDAPDIRISFGNGFPLFTSAMLQAGFPHDYFDTLGLDFDMYTSAPEDQPSMWYAPFSGIYYLRELRKVYGCEDKPLCLTEAIYCPTSPIWITEREQADYYVRSHLLALAMGVEQFGMCAEPIDPDGAYHYGHYGPVGLCHATPEMNPREAFCGYAAMTGLLDGARFDAMVDLGSPHAFCLRFGKAAGGYVHALWTVNGTRSLELQVDGEEELAVYNRDGRDISNDTVSRTPDSGSKNVTLPLDESPRYLVGPGRLKALRLTDTAPIPRPGGTRSLVRFDSLDGWEVTGEPLPGYEEINPATPVAWARLDLAVENEALHVRPPKRQDTHPLETLCMAMQRVGDPLLIPSDAHAIGVCARGNRSWGRVVFVLADDAGNRWVSAHAQTPVDVDGPVYLEMPLPKAPSDDVAGYRGYRPWRREKEDTVPEYPLRLTGILFETRTHAIHGPDLVPLSSAGFQVESVELRHEAQPPEG
jgi:hypothetical protein